METPICSNNKGHAESGNGLSAAAGLCQYIVIIARIVANIGDENA